MTTYTVQTMNATCSLDYTNLIQAGNESVHNTATTFTCRKAVRLILRGGYGIHVAWLNEEFGLISIARTDSTTRGNL